MERGLRASEDVIAVIEARGGHSPETGEKQGERECEFKSYLGSDDHGLVMEWLWREGRLGINNKPGHRLMKS